MGMSWNYRIFRHTQLGYTSYALHEMYYNPDGWTVDAISPHYETVAELIEDLAVMLRDAKKCKNDILEYERPKRTTKKTHKNAARKGKKGERG